MDRKRMEEAIARHRKAMDANDLAALVRTYAEDAVLENSGDAPVRGRKAIEDLFRRAVPATTEWRIDWLHVLSDGERACIECRNTRTVDGRHLDYRSAFLMRVNEKGEIVEDHTYFDTAEVARQLGKG